ncbi:hypothetical protein FOL47_002206, partial [Perkinsus chesapeaki]
FDHTVICLTNAEVEQRNREYLKQLPGEEYVFDAVDTGSRTATDGFDYRSLQKLGYRDKVILKEGCRVMATVNTPGQRDRIVNGLMGKVVKIYWDGEEQPVVITSFDGLEKNVHVKRQKLTVYGRDGSIRFERQQIPLTVSYAATAHKLVGATLTGVWLYLPNSHGRQTEMIRQYWDSPWLQGVIYTALSRVGSREKIRVFPLRNTMDPQLMFPIFSMNPAASAFDALCAERDWLLTARQPVGPPPDVRDKERSCDSELLASVVDHITNLRREIENSKQKMLLLHHYTTSRRSAVSGEPINPVFYCAQNPALANKIDMLSVEGQKKFYDLLDEKLNLTLPRPNDEHLQRIVNDLANEAGDPSELRQSQTNPTLARDTAGVEEGDQELIGEREGSDLSHIEEPSDRMSAGGDLSDGSGTRSSQSDSESSEEGEDSDSDDAPFEIPPHQNDPPSDEPEFADQPFTVYEGNLYDVVSDYIKEKPHYRLVNNLEELKHQRKTCYLECRRAVSPRMEGREPKRGSRPDWRLWPTFTCPLARVKIIFRDGRCSFYPLRSANASADDWRCHDHFPGTEKCRSGTIPPDVIDDWIITLSARPCTSKSELKTMAHQKNMSGQYSAQTTEFLTQKGLSNYEAVKAALRSIKESRNSGLSVTAFTRSLTELSCGPDRLMGEVSDIIKGLDALEAGTHSARDLELARRADCCLVMENILCRTEPEKAGTGSNDLKAYSAVVSSPRMLRSLRSCRTMGIDGTYNLTHADLTMGIICSLPATSTAQPIGIVIMTK